MVSGVNWSPRGVEAGSRLDGPTGRRSFHVMQGVHATGDDIRGREPDGESVAAALGRHYAAHGLPSDGGENDRWFRVRLGPITIPVPNPPARRRAVLFHDVNHILTAYNTVFSEGEVEIAAFECAAGCGRYGIAWFINITMFAIGLVINPRPVLRAWRRGRRSGSIYHMMLDRAALLAMPVDALRESLHIAAN